jgi:hypothetical protein
VEKNDIGWEKDVGTQERKTITYTENLIAYLGSVKDMYTI